MTYLQQEFPEFITLRTRLFLIEDEDEVRGDAQEVMDQGIDEELENLSCQEEVCRNG